ncbi:MAG: tRNA(Ile)-lysidine synthetase [Anaerolineae bacterium]|nr:adenine nucleotide alpha hydrolase family protein [Anaerolineae bacterium]MDW7990849.1 tRNA(Ile)-lysidine synthetase [Anaerolineae bacterium]
MRCRKCNRHAVLNMRQHKLALCEEHFPEWFISYTERTIRRYRMFDRDDRILVAVSGGKDSLSLWDVLLRLGYTADGLYIDLGIDGGFGYSRLSYEKVQAFVAAHPGVQLHVVNVAGLYGETIPEVASRKLRGRDKPCAVCGLIKRHEMNRVAQQEGYTVLATGHNLDDEVAVLLSNVLHWQTGYLLRQAPVLVERDGMARKVKPFCRSYEREVAAYALVQGIDYIYEECPYAVGNLTNFYKDLLARLEMESPGTKLQFYQGFLKAREEGFFCADAQGPVEMHPCPRCGQPTTVPGLCAFCRLWERDRMQMNADWNADI